MDKKTVRITGNSSGIMAIARVTPDNTLSISRSLKAWSGKSSQVKMPTRTKSTPASTEQELISWLVCLCSGVAAGTVATMPAPILPYSLAAPILSTSTIAEPWVTKVPA